jgi:O-antigen/teichoic acid export membrane protein
LLNALCLTQDALYRREFLFRRLAVRILLATIVGGAVGIAMATTGWGVWALVGQYITAAAVSVATLWYKPLWRPSRALDFRGLGALSRYGINIIGVRLLDFGASRFVEFWIAAMLGAAALGFFSVGSKIAYILLQLLGTSVLDVALAGFSRLASEPPRLRNAYYKVVRLTAVASFPCWALLAMASVEVTSLAFGTKWLPSAPLLVPMAILGAVQASQIFDSALVNAIGRPSLGVLFLIARTCAVLISLIATANSDLQTMVIGYVVAQLAVTPLNLVILRRFAGISPGQFLASLAPTLIATAVMCAAIAALAWFTPVAQWGAFWSLAAKASAGLAAYGLVLLAIDRRQIIDLVADLKSLRRQKIDSQ